MPIVLRAQIQRVVRNVNGPLFETVYLLAGSTALEPQWTRVPIGAGVWLWEQAEVLARAIDAFPVVVSTPGAEDEPPEPFPSYDRQAARAAMKPRSKRVRPLGARTVPTFDASARLQRHREFLERNHIE